MFKNGLHPVAKAVLIVGVGSIILSIILTFIIGYLQASHIIPMNPILTLSPIVVVFILILCGIVIDLIVIGIDIAKNGFNDYKTLLQETFTSQNSYETELWWTEN